MKEVRRMKGVVLAIALALVLQGCAATPYQAHGEGGGYSESQLDSNVFKVTFRGNFRTKTEQVADFALLRSAELTLANGFRYFSVTARGSGTDYGFWSGAQHWSSNTILCHKEKPESFAYDAALVREEMRRKHGL